MKRYSQKPVVNVKSHAEEKNFSCSVCCQSFKDDGYLKNHMKIRHPGTRQFSELQESLNVFPKEVDGIVRSDEKSRERNSSPSISKFVSVSNPIEKPALEELEVDKPSPGEVKNISCAIKESEQMNENGRLKSISSVCLTHHENKKLNKCETCCKVFGNRITLVRHMKIHTREKYKCGSCQRTFPRQDLLFQHKMLLHSGDGNSETETENSGSHTVEDGEKETYKCTACSKTFKIKTSFEKHVKNHDDQKAARYECRTCGKWFDSMTYLRQHKVIHSKGKPYKCKVCAKTFKYNVSYCKHMLSSHPGEKGDQSSSYTCTVCNKLFAKSYLLKGHTMIAHHTKNKSLNFKCLTCKKAFRTRFSLHRHVESHAGEKAFQCAVCNKTFRQKISARRHELMHAANNSHKGISSYSHSGNNFQLKLKCHSTKHARRRRIRSVESLKECSSDKPGPPFVCTICNRELASEANLVRHIENHSKTTHKCKHCDRNFGKNYLLKSHMKLIHKRVLLPNKDNGKGMEGLTSQSADGAIRFPVSSKLLYKCSVCGIVFIHSKELDSHMRIHTGQKPYECEECGEAFNGRMHFQKHLNMQHPVAKELPYTCTFCGKRFVANIGLQRHLVIHTGERNFPCPHCGLSFGRKGNMKAHVKRKHSFEENGNNAGSSSSSAGIMT